MNTFPLELINIIANNIQKITDKRQFTQTCKAYNYLMKSIIKKQELIFKGDFTKIKPKDISIKINNFEYPQNNCMEKFTIELCNDLYFNKIPTCYLTPRNNIIVKALIIYEQIELLKHAIDNGCKLLKGVENKYVYRDIEFIDSSCHYAVLSGNVDILKFVIVNGFIFGRLNGYPLNMQTSNCAAKYGHLNILKFLVTNECELGESVSLYAAKGGHIDILQWLVEINYKMHSFTCKYAVMGGSLSCLQWAIEHGCKFNVPEVYYTAAQYNEIHIIKWLRSNGYIWNSRTCVGAVRGNHLELLKWLVKEGCELSSEVCIVAMDKKKENNTEIQQWLIDNNCPTQ